MSNNSSPTIQTPMPGLATQIGDWLNKSKQVASHELTSLISDLNSGSNLESWAAVNFDRILPLRIPKAAMAAWFDLIRNALVLMPLAVTWIAIWSASRGYSDWYPQNPSSNFLVYWEDNLPGIFKLSYVAIFDGAILLAIFGMTIFSDLINKNSKLKEELERMHEGLIVSLERGLSSYRYLSLPELNQYASRTVQDVSTAAQQVASSIQAVAKTAQESEDLMVRLESIIRNEFQPTAAMFDNVVKGLSSAIGTHNQLVTVVQNAQNGLAATQQQMGIFVQQIQSGFNTELSALRLGIEDMVKTAGSGSQQIVQEFSVALNKTIQNLSSAFSQTVNDLSKSSADASKAMGQAAGSIVDVSDVLKSTMSSVELGVQRMNVDLDAIQRKIK